MANKITFNPLESSFDYVGSDTGGSGTDEKVKISSNDTTPGYLNGKIVAGSGVTLTENNDGGNETLTITATSTQEVEYTAENKDAGTIDAGMVIATHSSGTGVIKARADSNGTRGIALSKTTVAPTVSATLKTDGVFELADWTPVIGSTNLAAFAVYYLSPVTAGTLTAVAPTTSGHYVQRVGTAISSTALQIEIEQPILL